MLQEDTRMDAALNDRPTDSLWPERFVVDNRLEFLKYAWRPLVAKKFIDLRAVMDFMCLKIEL